MTFGTSATATAGPEADAAELSIAAQATLMFQQGLSVAEIASSLGIAAQTVSNLLDLASDSIAAPATQMSSAVA